MEKMKGNKNAEKWTLKEAEKVLQKAITISRGEDYDFIGEVAFDMELGKSTFTYLVDKFPELKPLYTEVRENCERNCFKNGKKGNIVPSMAIMNLKSNHGWTDRQQTDITTGGDKIQPTQIKFED